MGLDGKVLWERVFGAEDEHNQALSVSQTSDGGYVLAGAKIHIPQEPAQDIYIVRTDPNGRMIWDKDLGLVGFNNRAAEILQLDDGSFVVYGQRGLGANQADLYLAKLAAEESPQSYFVRGDANADGGVDLSDAVYTLEYLFSGGAQPSCMDAADANDSGDLNLSDPIGLLMFLFQGAGPLPEPDASSPGIDPTDDALDCLAYRPN